MDSGEIIPPSEIEPKLSVFDRLPKVELVKQEDEAYAYVTPPRNLEYKG